MDTVPLPKTLLYSIAEDSLNILAIWGNSELKNTQLNEEVSDKGLSHAHRTAKMLVP